MRSDKPHRFRESNAHRKSSLHLANRMGNLPSLAPLIVAPEMAWRPMELKAKTAPISLAMDAFYDNLGRLGAPTPIRVFRVHAC
jgi:hypothetical protein